MPLLCMARGWFRWLALHMKVLSQMVGLLDLTLVPRLGKHNTTFSVHIPASSVKVNGNAHVV